MEKLTDEQIKFLVKVCFGTWEQTDKGIVVNGEVNLFNINLNKIPVKFYKVYGYFNCSNNELTSLEGCPEYVARSFYCSYNKLTSLEGYPEYVGGILQCGHNKLTSLKGIGKVKGMICCSGNKIDYKREKELRPEIYKKIHLSTLEKMFYILEIMV